jgi:hypothetical protein
MSLYPPNDGVDVRSISSSTVSDALTAIATAAVGVQEAGNSQPVQEAIRLLNIVANLVRELHL